jgi:hypothetical protein
MAVKKKAKSSAAPKKSTSGRKKPASPKRSPKATGTMRGGDENGAGLANQAATKRTAQERKASSRKATESKGQAGLKRAASIAAKTRHDHTHNK